MDPKQDIIEENQEDEVTEQDVADEESAEEETEEGDETEGVMDRRPRFDLIESFFLLAFNGLGDALELLDLTGVGVVVGLAVDFINGPVTILYLYIKGVKKTVGKNALAQVVEIIPGLDILPIRTTVMLLTIMTTNNPDRFKKLQSVLSLMPKGKK